MRKAAKPVQKDPGGGGVERLAGALKAMAYLRKAYFAATDFACNSATPARVVRPCAASARRE